MRQAGAPEPPADGGSHADHDAMLTQNRLGSQGVGCPIGIQQSPHDGLMRREDRTAEIAKAGRPPDGGGGLPAHARSAHTCLRAGGGGNASQSTRPALWKQLPRFHATDARPRTGEHAAASQVPL